MFFKPDIVHKTLMDKSLFAQWMFSSHHWGIVRMCRVADNDDIQENDFVSRVIHRCSDQIFKEQNYLCLWLHVNRFS